VPHSQIECPGRRRSEEDQAGDAQNGFRHDGR
jgi:hypothetical protein